MSHAESEFVRFGLTVTEALWRARPVIASATGGITEQITEGVNGLLVSDPGDLEAFANTLARLLCDDEQAGRLGACPLFADLDLERLLGRDVLIPAESTSGLLARDLVRHLSDHRVVRDHMIDFVILWTA